MTGRFTAAGTSFGRLVGAGIGIPALAPAAR